DQLALLQPFLREQRDLLARQQQLNELIAVARSVRENRIMWTGAIAGLLETLPVQGSSGRPNVDVRQRNMRAVVPPRAEPHRCDGRPIVAEMNVTGTVVSAEVWARFIRALENSRDYGVAFQSAQRQSETDLYDYSLT